jgi:hypothetical protein
MCQQRAREKKISVDAKTNGKELNRKIFQSAAELNNLLKSFARFSSIEKRTLNSVQSTTTHQM